MDNIRLSMPDITKCEGGECPIKNKCYRYTSPSSMYQSFMGTPYNFEKKECEFLLKRKYE